jgi:uncharacterized membrane protein YgdD (TMEM256/DUF423 family)
MSPNPDVDRYTRACTIAGALLMFAGLILGALGTHYVAHRVTPERLASWETAVLYQLLHGLGLLLLAAIARATTLTTALRWAARAMFAGVLLFSGSIYLAAAGVEHATRVAPTGGSLLMAAWLLVAANAWRGVPGTTE